MWYKGYYVEKRVKKGHPIPVLAHTGVTLKNVYIGLTQVIQQKQLNIYLKAELLKMSAHDLISRLLYEAAINSSSSSDDH